MAVVNNNVIYTQNCLVCRNPFRLADAFSFHGMPLSGCRPTLHLVVIEPVGLYDNFVVLDNITLTELANRRHY